MSCNVEVVEQAPQLARQRRDSSVKGSRRGYNADIDDLPESFVDGEKSCVECAAPTKGKARFYSHIRPRGRNKRKACGRSLCQNEAPRKRPDIDLSLVSLLSSKELDRRFGCNRNSKSSSSASYPAFPLSSDSSSGNSSDMTEFQVNEKIIKKEKKCAHLASPRPLAVIDYGSIELDMSGSMLDSIYNICGSDGRTRSAGSKDWIIGGRRFSCDPSCGDGTNDDATIKAHRGKNLQCKGTTSESSAFAAIPQKSFTVATSRSIEVEAVIASLKQRPAMNRASSSYSQFLLEDTMRKKRRVGTASEIIGVETSAVFQSATTLEDAISFSPFARVLFCANAPYTVVHTNAAYSSLVQKGLAKQCVVGDPLSPGDICEGESSEQYIIRLVASHVGVFKQEEECTQKPPGFIGCQVHVYPVMSCDETCRPNGGSHEDHCTSQDREFVAATSCSGNLISSLQGAPYSVKSGGICADTSQYLSHYLLQIEPNDRL